MKITDIIPNLTTEDSIRVLRRAEDYDVPAEFMLPYMVRAIVRLASGVGELGAG